MANNQSEGFLQLRILRGHLDSLSLYEITDYELEILEEGSPNSTYLNFAIFFLSLAISFFTTLVTVAISQIYLFTIFVVITIVGFAFSLVLFILWYKTRTRTKQLIKKIKARVPTSPVMEIEAEVKADNPCIQDVLEPTESTN